MWKPIAGSIFKGPIKDETASGAKQVPNTNMLGARIAGVWNEKSPVQKALDDFADQYGRLAGICSHQVYMGNTYQTNMTVDDEIFRSAVVRMRLRVREGAGMPFEFFGSHATSETVYVFIVQNGKPVMLEDDPNLFPSDNLITQLNLLRK